jgi:hypothetical protein
MFLFFEKLFDFSEKRMQGYRATAPPDPSLLQPSLSTSISGEK